MGRGLAGAERALSSSTAPVLSTRSTTSWGSTAGAGARLLGIGLLGTGLLGTGPLATGLLGMGTALSGWWAGMGGAERACGCKYTSSLYHARAHLPLIMAGCIAMLKLQDNIGRHMMTRKAYMLMRNHGLYALAAN